MSKINSITEEDTKERPPLFEHFQWHAEESDNTKLPTNGLKMRFVSKVLDVSGGVSLIMQAIEFDNIQGAFNDAQELFSEGDRSRLQRLAITSLELLQDEAARLTDLTCENEAKTRKKLHEA